MIFVTAELGVNWKGDYKILRQMIERCKKAGVDYVKFQALSEDLIKRHPELAYYRDASVNAVNSYKINQICGEYGIGWYASVTYPEAIEFLKYHTHIYKIRVADASNVDIIDACARDLMEREPDDAKLIISSSRPLPQSVFDPWPDLDIINLYCIPQYPTLWGEINFDMLKNPDFEGYSNHCKNPLALLKAARMGAKYIEFHLTHNDDDFALDNKVSLSYSEMEEVMAWLKKLG